MREMQAAWPSQADYIMALQDPPSAFVDPSLQGGTVESDRVLDLPKPRSGQMASVYKVFDGRKTWAVRCFNFASEERAGRYRAISSFLARNPNRYTVDFAYVEEGISVASRFYPIVKMEWIEGDLLHIYIAEHLAAPAVLHRLAYSWVEMTRALHELGMAHCDLQHGNVIVTPAGELKLIDYDGMFVPEFSGMPSIEDGHPNYQHPCRQSGDFGPRLDNFSAWVVYLSLTAVAHDPGVWEKLRCGDDCLAFRRADFVRPSESAAFAHLAACADPDVRKIAEFVRSMLSHEPAQLPDVERYARIVRAPGAEGRGPGFAPFAAERLAGGVFTEPYEPQRAAPRPIPVALVLGPSKFQRTAARAAVGVALTAAGSWAFHVFGFATEQIAVVVVLGWMLAAILAIASRNSKPPGSFSN